MDIISALEWRYATKKIVPQEKIDKILKAAYLAPSGIDLQPYVIIVISDQKLKEKILPVAMNQRQVTESSHLLIFVVWDEYHEDRIDGVFDYLNHERGTVTIISDNQRNFAKKFFSQKSLEENFHHAAKQANIALALTIASLHKVKVFSKQKDSSAKASLLPQNGKASIVH